MTSKNETPNLLEQMLNSKIEDEKSMLDKPNHSEYYKGRIDAFQFVLDILDDYPFVALGSNKPLFLEDVHRVLDL